MAQNQNNAQKNSSYQLKNLSNGKSDKFNLTNKQSQFFFWQNASTDQMANFSQSIDIQNFALDAMVNSIQQNSVTSRVNIPNGNQQLGPQQQPTNQGQRYHSHDSGGCPNQVILLKTSDADGPPPQQFAQNDKQSNDIQQNQIYESFSTNKKNTAPLAGGFKRHDPQAITKYSANRGEVWSRNNQINASSNERGSTGGHGSFKNNHSVSIQGIQGLGYPNQQILNSSMQTTKYVSTYQKLQSDKAKAQLEQQARQMNQQEREKDLQLGGTQLQNPNQNSSQSPQPKVKVPNLPQIVDFKNQSQSSNFFRSTQNQFTGLSHLNRQDGGVGSSQHEKSMQQSALGDGIIISKINVCQPKAEGLSHRKTQLNQLDMKSKKAQVGFKFYQTLAGGFHQSHNQQNASPTSNLDLEYLIKNDLINQKSIKNSNTKQTVKRDGQHRIQTHSQEKESLERVTSQKQDSRGLTKHEESHALNQRYSNSREASLNQEESLQVMKAVLTPKNNLRHHQLQNHGGNLKYHVIRQLLEKADPSEVRKIMESQQRQLHNQTEVSNEEEKSSKEIPNQASLLLGESLLMENSETNHRLIGSSKLKKRQREKIDQGLNTNNQQQQKSINQKSNHESLEKLIQAQMDMKNQMLLQSIDGKKSQKRVGLVAPQNQKFQIRISSNSRERSRNDENQRSDNKSHRQSRNSRHRTQRLGGGGAGMAITSGHGTLFTNNQNNTQNTMFNGEHSQANFKNIDGTTSRWEDSLCVQIRQLPIYSRDGTAIQLQHFACPDQSNRKSGKSAHLNIALRSHYQSLNPSKLNKIDNYSLIPTASKKNVIDQSSNQISQNATNGSRYLASRDFRFKTSRQNIGLNQKQHKIIPPVNGVTFDQNKKSLNIIGKVGNINTNAEFIESDGHGQSPSSILKAIKVPHIEFQQEILRKSLVLNQTGPNQNNLLKDQNSPDQTPIRNDFHSKRRQSEKPMTFLNAFAPSKQNFANSSAGNIFKGNPIFQAYETKAQNALIQNSVSQKSINGQGIESNASQILQPTLNHASTVLQSNLQLLQDNSPTQNNQNPAVLVINQSSTSELQKPTGFDQKTHSITVTIAGQRLSLDANFPQSKVSMVEGPIKEEISPNLRNEMTLKEPSKYDLPFTTKISTVIDRQKQKDVGNVSERRVSKNDSRIGPLYQAESSIFQNFKRKEVTLPNLNKKYMVGLQQQLYNVSETGRERKTKIQDRENRLKEALEREKLEQGMRENKQSLLINSFERLSKHMKQRNFQRLYGATDKSRFMQNKFHMEYDSLMALNSDQLQSNTLDEAGSTNNWNVQLSQNDICGFASIQSQVLKEGSMQSPRMNRLNSNAMENSSNNKFFKALQKQMSQNHARTIKQQETTLMRKTHQQMQFAHLSCSDRMKTKCLMTRGNFCSFEIVRNILPVQAQQLQLARILKVPENEILEQVPFLKQTCLVEFIKDTWPSVLNNQKSMKDYQFFCLYYPQRKYYNLIIFGNETPISKCCQQLIVFQFNQPKTNLNSDSSVFTDPALNQFQIVSSYGQAHLRVYCSDPQCSETPLQEVIIDSKQFIESILNTANGAQLVTNQYLQRNNQGIIVEKGMKLRSQNHLISPKKAKTFHSPIKHIGSDKNLRDKQNDSLIKAFNGLNSDSLEDEEETLGEDYNYDSHQYLRAGSQAYQRDDHDYAQNLSKANNRKQKKRFPQAAHMFHEDMNIQESAYARALSGDSKFSGEEKIADISINKYFARKQSNKPHNVVMPPV